MAHLFPRRALISVSDKTGILELAFDLVSQGIEIISTGGTHKVLLDAGIPSKEISNFTGFPEGLDGRVKTLHPAIHAGLLSIRGLAEHDQYLNNHRLEPIDLLICNLYPFEMVVGKKGSTHQEIIENIDIGGPSMVRSACKNYLHVAVATNPAQYGRIRNEIRSGGISSETREHLAREAFLLIARYDSAIARYFCEKASDLFPSNFPGNFELRTILRYGENPHQKAALYLTHDHHDHETMAQAKILNGKELSYNNWLDLDAAWSIVNDIKEPAACIIKHTNPCGAAISSSAGESFKKAYDADPTSAFGGIVGLNRQVDAATAEIIAQPGRFLECIIAADYTKEAFEILTTKPSWKKNIRLIKAQLQFRLNKTLEFRSIDGGVLVQEVDNVSEGIDNWVIASNRHPTHSEKIDLELAWSLAAKVKSNAIVLVKGGVLIGVGQGQTSRVESVRLAVSKAGNSAIGSVLGSDAFFPFRDGVDIALRAGVTAVIQPGGSIRDDETIAACDEHGVALIMTGVRHFRH